MTSPPLSDGTLHRDAAGTPLRWRAAWHNALYGGDGFFRRQAPVDHFRTSVNSSGAFAAAIWRLVQSEGLVEVVDIGAGRGELLVELDRLSGGTLRLTGVEIADRPARLPPTINWLRELPAHINGLLIANEWLDNIPCDVVEADDDGKPRYVLVAPHTGAESLGAECTDPWLDRWWPIRTPGLRAEIGTSRDVAWAEAVGRVDGIALAVDYGHTSNGRPPFGSLRSYQHGHEVDVVPDGSRDVTAHVAVDSIVATSGAVLSRQSDALRDLGVTGERPPLELAGTDPAAYVRALSAATLSAELTSTGGWGDFWWMRVDTRVTVTD